MAVIKDINENVRLGGKRMKKKYRISVHGCDDSTIIEKELTEDELKTIQSVAAEVTESSEYVCMPTMRIEELKQ